MRREVKHSSDTKSVKIASSRVVAAVSELWKAEPSHWLIAVSGGADSMCLLHAAICAIPPASLSVVTFDHGTGEFATEAAEYVTRFASDCGITVFAGRASERGRTEAEWRKQRWQYINSVHNLLGSSTHRSGPGAVRDHYAPPSESPAIASLRVKIATAHTLSDQIETVFMRILRGSGGRGLAGLYTKSETIIRPLLPFTRQDILEYLEAENIRYITDPSNVSRVHLRNRVRHDLLPAIERVRPGFSEYLVQISRASAKIRDYIEDVARNIPLHTDDSGSVYFPVSHLKVFSLDSLKALLPALLARVGIVMDWRGTERLSEFTIRSETGKVIQLSGGIEVKRLRDSFAVKIPKVDI